MGRPRTHSDEEILETARSCFLAQGPSVPISTIAAELGLSGPALLHRFGSKQQLLIAAMCPDPAQLPLQALRRGVSEEPIPIQMREVAREIATHLRRVMPRMAVLRAAGISPFDAWSHYEAPPPIIIHRALTDWVTAALQQGRLRPCEPVHVASAFMGGLQAQAILTIAGQAPASEEENERYINHLVQIHWEGLSPLSEST